MKNKLIFLVLLLSGFAIFLVVNEFVLKDRTPMGRIKVLSSPSAGVFIDNVAVGKTPFEQKIEAGEYVIKLIPEGVAGDTVSWQGTIRVAPDSLTYINRELGESEVLSAGEIFLVEEMEERPEESGTGEVFVETEPSGAIVYLDNDEKGVSPILLQGVTQGDHEISVYMPGFFRRTHKINVDANRRTTTQFQLALDESQQSIDEVTEDAEEAAASEEAALAEEAGDDGLDPSVNQVEILQTPTGWLRVRAEPTTNSAEVAKADPGTRYELLDQSNGWYQIALGGDETGWVSNQYAEIKTPEQLAEEEAAREAEAAAQAEEEAADDEDDGSAQGTSESDE